MGKRGPDRYVWVVTSPNNETKPRVYINQKILERDLPEAIRNKKKQVDNAGDVWHYGRKNVFIAMRLKIRDFESAPR